MINLLLNKIYKNPLKEVFFAYTLSLIIFFFARFIPFIIGTVIFATLLYIPVISAHIKKIDFFNFGLSNIDLKKSFLWFIIASITIFPTFFLVGSIYLSVDKIVIPKNMFEYTLQQIFIIGFSEEFFYRGYIQPLVKKSVQKEIIKTIGLDYGVVITSLLFSIGHFLTYFTFFSILTFFPSLIFGILKNKTGTIYSSMFFHGLSNISLYILINSL